MWLVTLFVLATAASTLVLLGVAIGGLGVVWRERGHARRLAEAEGWRHAGHGQFTGIAGGCDWRAGRHQDDDTGRRWIEFEGGAPGVHPGGFVIVSRTARTTSQHTEAARQRRVADGGALSHAGAALERRIERFVTGWITPETPGGTEVDDPHRWPAVEVGGASFSAAWVMLADRPCWAAALTAEVERLWVSAGSRGELRAHAQAHRLRLERAAGSGEPAMDEVAEIARLGVALLRSAQAAALAGPARTAYNPESIDQPPATA